MQMLTQTFGEMLHYPQGDCLAEFPSPESLKHQIIISTKPPKEYLEESKQIKDKGSILNSGKESSEEDASGKEISDPTAEPEEVERVS